MPHTQTSLNSLALDWTARTPRLVTYLGRIEGAEPLCGAEAVVSGGASRVVVPHDCVFRFASVCSDLALHRLVRQVGTA